MMNMKKPIENSALIVVDVQDSFIGDNEQRWAQRGPNPEQFEEKLTTLLTTYRQAQLPIYFVLHSDEDPWF